MRAPFQRTMPKGTQFLHTLPPIVQSRRRSCSACETRVREACEGSPELVVSGGSFSYVNLQRQVQIRLVSEGYDPMLGIMHYDRDGAPAFVFDMMEPERPKVDRAVLGFLKSEALHPADFTIREDGVARLNPELARQVARLAA